MAGTSLYLELSEGQRQIYGATAEVYQEYLETLRQGQAHKGGMHWKKIRGREYLYRYRDRFGHGESLGPRSEATEQIYDDFARQRREVHVRLQAQRLRLKEQARFCRAAALPRVPATAAKILRRLEQDAPGANFLVVGSAALFAYEFAAGVFLAGSGATDLLAPASRGLTLAGNGQLSQTQLLQLLRQADRSFAPLNGEGCRAATREGFLVTLLKSSERRPGRQKALTVPGAREPLPPDAGNLQYLTVSPKLSQVVIGLDGGPATLVVPDPRTFALHKLWLSCQEDREAAHRARDRDQALAVADLVLRYLPQYDFSSSELEMFPRELASTGDDDDLASTEEFYQQN